MSYIVTGGAGFIGSCIIRELNDRSIYDIIVVDNVAETDKWLNLRNKKYKDYIHKNRLEKELYNIEWGGGRSCYSYGSLFIHY